MLRKRILVVCYRRFGFRFKVQAVMILGFGTNRLSRNVVNDQSTLRDIPEERKSHLLMMVCDRWKQGPNHWKILKTPVFLVLLCLLHWFLSGINSDVSCLVLTVNVAEGHPFTGVLNCALKWIRSWQDSLDQGSTHREVSTNTGQP